VNEREWTVGVEDGRSESGRLVWKMACFLGLLPRTCTGLDAARLDPVVLTGDATVLLSAAATHRSIIFVAVRNTIGLNAE
jgi:hypothetical protein